MTDIVERVREACNGHPHAKIEWPHRILHEAADEIERLRDEVQHLGILLTVKSIRETLP